MNKFHKYIKIFSVLVLSSLMLLAVAFPGTASESDKPIISIDPAPVVVTIAVVFALFFAMIALAYFLVKHISESKTRVKRLSKVESEETIQLYDDLEAMKWDPEIAPEDKPRDVLLDDELSKTAKANATHTSDGYEEGRHGPVPERDMPGYDPYAANEDREPKPVTPMPTPPNQYAPPPQMPYQAPAGAPMMYGQVPPAPAPYPYAPAPMGTQPRVYRPDSDVEIIMHDTSAAPATYTVASEPSHKRVRAYKRRGRIPARYVYTAPVVAEPLSTVPEDTLPEEEIQMPRIQMSHLNIGPLGKVTPDIPYRGEGDNYTINVNVAGAQPGSEPEPIREAPILDPSEIGESYKSSDDVAVVREPAFYKEATVEIDPPRRKENETIIVQLGDDLVDGKLMRTLDDVLEELGDDDVTEIEAPIDPIYEEELIFVGNESVSSDDIPEDDVFDDEEGEARMFIDGKYVTVKYRTSFMSRFVQSEELIQDYYSVIKNVLMSYEGVSAEMSWSCETFTRSETVCAKVNIKEKMLLLYLALDPEKYKNSKYHYSYSYDKYAKYKNSNVSMMVKIKNDRALKYAIELIMAMMEELNAEAGVVQDIDYHHAYESTEQLIARGLIKILPTDAPDENESAESEEVNVAEIIENTDETEELPLDEGAVFDFEEESAEESAEEIAEEPVEEHVEEPVEEIVEEPVEEIAEESVEESVEEVSVEAVEAPAEETAEAAVEELPIPVHEVIHAAASEVDELLTDEEAIESIEIVEDKTHTHSGKMVEVNLDSICEAFADGDVVTIDELKAKKLISKSSGRVKILARGVMTKTLTIYADKFSLQAVKMITLAGGHAEQYK